MITHNDIVISYNALSARKRLINPYISLMSIGYERDDINEICKCFEEGEELHVASVFVSAKMINNMKCYLYKKDLII